MCFIPIRLETGDFVPCSRCGQCKKDYAQGWAFRIKIEERNCITSNFVTLTYSDENIPYGMGGTILYYPDIQNYIKRLRKAEKGNTIIKYFAVGERGGKLDRPHWHLIIFNAQDTNIIKAWRNQGITTIEPLTEGRIMYTLKYLTKDYANEGTEYITHMSQGIGKDYLTTKTIAWHKKGYKTYVTEKGGYKKKLPRYYKNIIFDDPYSKAMIKHKAMQYLKTKEEQAREWQFRETLKWEKEKKEHYEKQTLINIKQTI